MTKKRFLTDPVAVATHFVTILIILATAGLIFFYWAGLYVSFFNKKSKEKYGGHLLVLGKKTNGVPDGCLKGRITKCQEMMDKDKFSSVILSGGGKGNSSEASVMKNHLTYSGEFLIEEKSSNTYENLMFSKILIPKNDHVVIISSNYHLRRIHIFAKDIFSSYDLVAAPTPRQPISRHFAEISWGGWLEIYSLLKTRF